LGVCNEVRGNVTAIELHSVDNFDLGLKRLGFLHRNYASLPTFCMAFAIIWPILALPLEEMVPTWATSAEEPTFFARFPRSLTTAVTAMSTPRLRSIGFMPAATDLTPSFTIA